MKIRPLNDRILVKRLEGEEKTAGGIIIPDSAKEKPAEGEIVAVGPGKLNDNAERVAMDVAVGDRVLFSKYGGTEVKLDGEDFLANADGYADETVGAAIRRLIHALFAGNTLVALAQYQKQYPERFECQLQDRLKLFWKE